MEEKLKIGESHDGFAEEYRFSILEGHPFRSELELREEKIKQLRERKKSLYEEFERKLFTDCQIDENGLVIKKTL